MIVFLLIMIGAILLFGRQAVSNAIFLFFIMLIGAPIIGRLGITFNNIYDAAYWLLIALLILLAILFPIWLRLLIKEVKANKA